MPCDRKLRKGQSLSERKAEIRTAVEQIAKGLIAGRIKPVIGPQGSIAFQGLTEDERAGVDDLCAYRRLLATGSPLALQAIQKAELLAGRKVDKQAVAQGWHQHGSTWHQH